jgi:hypothetical protein
MGFPFIMLWDHMLVSAVYWQMLGSVCLLGSNLNAHVKLEKFKPSVGTFGIEIYLLKLSI